jgi:hypothetical protein
MLLVVVLIELISYLCLQGCAFGPQAYGSNTHAIEDLLAKDPRARQMITEASLHTESVQGQIQGESLPGEVTRLEKMNDGSIELK